MRIRSCLLMLLVLTATAAFAQDPEIDEYMGAWPFLQVIIQSLMWGVIYFAIVTFGLIASLVFLQRYTGLDTTLIFWIAALWVGILAIHILAYQPFIPHRALSILLAAPLVFGLTMLICVQPWADLSTREAMIVAIVLVVLCTPYLIPPWRLNRQPRPTPPEEEAYLLQHFALHEAEPFLLPVCLREPHPPAPSPTRRGGALVDEMLTGLSYTRYSPLLAGEGLGVRFGFSSRLHRSDSKETCRAV